MIDDVDKKIIKLIQEDLPMVLKPFSALAKRAGLGEKELINRIRDMKKRGIVRRFGATLRHQEAGFSSNAMVAWCVPDERVEEVGRILAGFREVTHCYLRKTSQDWKYNIYTMIHGETQEECIELTKRMAEKVGIDNYQVLFSKKEFKKTTMRYF